MSHSSSRCISQSQKPPEVSAADKEAADKLKAEGERPAGHHMTCYRFAELGAGGVFEHI